MGWIKLSNPCSHWDQAHKPHRSVTIWAGKPRKIAATKAKSQIFFKRVVRIPLLRVKRTLGVIVTW